MRSLTCLWKRVNAKICGSYIRTFCHSFRNWDECMAIPDELGRGTAFSKIDSMYNICRQSDGALHWIENAIYSPFSRKPLASNITGHLTAMYFFLTSHYILRPCVFVTDGCRLVFIKDNFHVIQPCEVFVVKCKVLRRKKLTYFCYFFLRSFYGNLSGRLCCDISEAVCLNFLLLANLLHFPTLSAVCLLCTLLHD